MRWLHFNISYLSCKALCKMDIFSVAAISEQIRQCLDVSPKKILLDMAVQNIVGD